MLSAPNPSIIGDAKSHSRISGASYLLRYRRAKARGTVIPLWRALLVAVPPCQVRRMPQARTAHDTRSARWWGQLMRREQLRVQRGRPSEERGRQRGSRDPRLENSTP